jgi:hypothetical protein
MTRTSSTKKLSLVRTAKTTTPDVERQNTSEKEPAYALSGSMVTTATPHANKWLRETSKDKKAALLSLSLLRGNLFVAVCKVNGDLRLLFITREHGKYDFKLGDKVDYVSVSGEALAKLRKQ